ncbi:MAG: DNA-binding protein [Prevotellaceae bacterium]|nr:DNA-binding protein [Prevotella sp.]MDD7256700.1 DNA-binding protein [Prevotellaceae bacterium]MDY6129788.1 DNA-binding protein [Prevotella sp.]
MKHDVLTDAMIKRAIKSAADSQTREREKQERQARKRLELQRRGERLQMERAIIHDAQQTIKGINDAIMAHFGKK